MNTLKVNNRDLSTNVTKMRSNGVVPGVLYGPNIEHQLIEMSRGELLKSLEQSGEVYEVKSRGRKCFVKFNEIQRNPVKDDVLHFSLVELPKGIESDIEVPVTFMGDCEGVKKGGVLITMKDNLTVTSSPSKMPESIEIDVSQLMVGDNITIGDVEKNQDVTIVGDSDEVIVMCQAVNLDEEIDNEETTTEVIETDANTVANE